jgi:chemosensory pili system protein ChpA (sensor histidine kinase/response regulator)
MTASLAQDQPSSRAGDYLGLLKDELIEHVRRARAALAAPAEPLDTATSPVAACLAELEQIAGALDSLGLESLALLARELRRVAGQADRLAAESRDEQLAALRNGLDQLRDNIERRAAGRSEDVWGLVAVLNELRAGGGLPLVSESRLFAPGLEARIHAEPVFPDRPSRTITEVAQRERPTLLRGMFLWFSQRDPERGRRKLRRVAQRLRQIAGTERLKELFLAFEAVVVAFGEQGVSAPAPLRRLMAGVDAVLKQLGEQGEQAVTAFMPVELLRNLLFYVARSGSVHHVVQSVRGRQDLRLLAVSGLDGRERAVPLLLVEVARLRDRLRQIEEDADPAQLVAAAQRLSDGLALAQLGEERRLLDPALIALQGWGAGARVTADALTGLAEVLASIEASLGSPEFGAASATGSRPAGNVETEATGIDEVEEELAAVDETLDLPKVEYAPAAPSAGPVPLSSRPVSESSGHVRLDDDIRDIFLDEASEKVETVRHLYVSWSAQRDDRAALDGALEALEGLKSTGRLVGADTLSEVSWVLEAALRRCREGTLTATDSVLAALDDGVEMIDALVEAHAHGTAVPRDPREVEERLYALLEPVHGPATAVPSEVADGDSVSAAADLARGRVDLGTASLDAEASTGDLGLLELFAEEAAELADALEDGLAGLEQDPARSSWLLEMRRALRGLTLAARQAGIDDWMQLSETFEAFLATAADTGVNPEVLALTREATAVVSGAVDALRQNQLPRVPPGLVERLRGAPSDAAQQTARQASGAPQPPAAAISRDGPAGDSTSEAFRPAPEVAKQLCERVDGAGVRHFQLEEQVAVLREQVGRLEGVLALLRRPARGRPAEVLPTRVAAALDDLAGCADRLHEASLAISSHLRGQGHQLSDIPRLLTAVFDRQGMPTFVDLLLVEVADAVYALPTAVVESVRRVAAELIPAEGGAVDLRGRSYAFRLLGDALGLPDGSETAADWPRSIVLAQAGGRVRAYGVDRVLGQRTLLVRPAADGADLPPWISGLVALGADRVAPVLDLEALPGG